MIDPFLAKLEEWMEQSNGRSAPMSPTTSWWRWAMAVGAHDPAGRGRAPPRRPAAGAPAVGGPSPGCGSSGTTATVPFVGGFKAVLFCAWLAWSRFRVVIPIRDKTLPTVVGCVDQTLRRFGGCPTYGLSDNEKTLTVDHVARIAIRNPEMVAAAAIMG